jgi:PAS domain S-box-containing protein
MALRIGTPRSSWSSFLVSGVAFVALTSLAGDAGVYVGALVLGLAVVAAIVRGVRRSRPATPAPWYLFASAIVAVQVGDVLYAIGQRVPSDAIFAVAYAQFILALGLFVRSRTRRSGRVERIDGLVIAVGIGVFVWMLVAEPILRQPALAPYARFTDVTYCVFDLVFLALLARIVLNGATGNAPYLLIATSAALNILADQLTIVTDTGLAVPGWVPVDLASLGFVLIGAAALHPAMASLSAETEVAPTRLGRRRVVALIAAAMAAPVVDGVDLLRGVEDSLALLVAWAMISVLVIARLVEVVRERERATRRQAILHEAAAAFAVAATPDELHQTAVGAAQLLVGPAVCQVATILLPREDGLRPVVAAPARATREGQPFRVDELDPEAREALAAPRFVDLQRSVGRHGEIDATVVAPFGGESPWRGVLVCRSDRYIGSETVTAIGALVTELWMALESTDLAEQLHRERSGRVSRALIDGSPDLILIVDSDGCVRFANPASVALLGRPPAELIGRPALPDLHPDDLHLTAALVPHGPGPVGAGPVVVRLRHADGSWRWCELRTSDMRDTPEIGGVVLNARDVSDRKRAEQLDADLAQAARLEAVGRLASGVAHEVNTPVQFVGNNLMFLSESWDELVELLTGTAGPQITPEVADQVAYLFDEVPRAIAQSIAGVARISNIVRAMKTLGVPSSAAHTVLDVNDVLRDALTICAKPLRDIADVELALGAVPKVAGQIVELGQVFLNLLVNAADAIRDRGDGRRGTITVRTSLRRGTVVVDFTDTGCGIPADIADRIFDPFFTTKEPGRGTGQGLALARSIVERHGGNLGFTTVPGIGTTFSVRLPTNASQAAIGAQEDAPTTVTTGHDATPGRPGPGPGARTKGPHR